MLAVLLVGGLECVTARAVRAQGADVFVTRPAYPPEQNVFPCAVGDTFQCWAVGGPEPGKYTWTIGSQVIGPDAGYYIYDFPVTEPDNYPVSVRFTRDDGQGYDDDEGGAIQGIKAWPNVGGETTVYIDVNGMREEVDLACLPDDTGTRHKAELSVPNDLTVYAGPTGQTLVTDRVWDDYDLDNWSERPESVWVQATELGEMAVTLKYTMANWVYGLGHPPEGEWYPAAHTGTLTLTAAHCGLKSVTFMAPQGGGFHDVYVDTTGVAYATPHWQDNSDSPQNQGVLDGDADDWQADPADHMYPVCYESSKKLKVTVLMLADPAQYFPNATIEGDGPDDLDFQAVAADFQTINGKSYATKTFESAAALTSAKVDWFHPMAIKWTLRSGGAVLKGTSDNEVFVTLAEPQCATLYRTVAYLACSKTGATDDAGALANTWDLFSDGAGDGEHPADVKGWNEETRTYNRLLYYYYNSVGHNAVYVGQLLEVGDGQCHAWAELLRDSLLANAVSNVTRIRVWPKAGCSLLAVKVIAFDDVDPEFPNEGVWRYGTGDLDTSPQGKPGQNMTTPAAKIFDKHFIVDRYVVQAPDGTFYDPSYGITATTARQYTLKAFAGWAKQMGGTIHWRKVDPNDNDDKAEFEHWPW